MMDMNNVGNEGGGGEEEMEELSPERLDICLQLQELTGLEDLEICRALLESKNWDLSATATAIINEAPSPPPPPPSNNHSRSPPPPPRRRGGGNSSSLMSWLTFPIYFPFRIFKGVLSFLFRFLGFQENNRITRDSDPTVDVGQFIDYFGDAGIPWSRGNYTTNLDSAQTRLEIFSSFIYIRRIIKTRTDSFKIR